MSKVMVRISLNLHEDGGSHHELGRTVSITATDNPRFFGDAMRSALAQAEKAIGEQIAAYDRNTHSEEGR